MRLGALAEEGAAGSRPVEAILGALAAGSKHNVNYTGLVPLAWSVGACCIIMKIFLFFMDLLFVVFLFLVYPQACRKN